MKRVIFGLLALVLLASPVFAAQTQTEIVDETLSTSNTIAEGDCNVEDSERITFFATIDNNRTTAAVTAKVTAAVSIDGVNWQDISWMDVAGGVTPQTTETTANAVQTYVGWLDNRIQAKYLRIRVYADDLETSPSRYIAADNATITVTVVEDK